LDGDAIVDLGIDVLEQSNYGILKGKRVGLITNQTGVDRKEIRVPVPYVHGMTVGELVQMVNAKGWAGAHSDLTVIAMHGWGRGTTWGDTLLRPVPTSPNIPHAGSAFAYVVTGMAGELAGVETGVGGHAPG
jgi:uncharacterized protein YbbC (DUF1343 family)